MLIRNCVWAGPQAAAKFRHAVIRFAAGSKSFIFVRKTLQVLH